MIRNYVKTDFQGVRKIAYSMWGDELKMSKELNDFLPYHYAYENELSYVYEDDNNIYGFALAHDLKEKNDADSFFLEGLNKLNENDKAMAIQYNAYLEDNEKEVIKHMNKDDVYFGLLASAKKGAGRALIENLKQKSKEKGYKRIFFWTDETCDYEYYFRNGFIKVDEFTISLYGKTYKTFIFMIDLAK